MSEPIMPVEPELGNAAKNRDQFLKVLSACVRRHHIDVSGKVLIVGGSVQDVGILQSVGFRRMTLSNFQPVSCSAISESYGSNVDVVCADAENMELPDESYDFVIAHEVLHHCRSPHVALGQMLRVSGRYVVILEPNDAWFTRTLVRTGFSFPYELPAVIYHNYASGGVRDSCVPNFIYRWNRNEIFKTISSFIPERDFTLEVYPYWDFNVDAIDLDLRTQTRIRMITRFLGVDGFLKVARLMQRMLNRIPFMRKQGNKFFCCIEKKELKPWLVRHGNSVSFNREFGRTG